MKKNRQVRLPLGRLPKILELVPGINCYHLRSAGGLHTFCGRLTGPDPTGSYKRQAGWGRIQEEQRCRQCERHLKNIDEN